MAVNATPEYEKAELRYRQATTPSDQLAALQEMFRLMPKHKASEKLQAKLKTKMSTLRREIARAKPATAVAHVDPFHIPATGAGQVVLVGQPNTGKSSVVAAVTNAAVKVAEFPFSTSTPVPGMWHWQDVQIQLIDTPPIASGQIDANFLNLLRRCELVLLAIDASSPENLEQAEATLLALRERSIDLFDLPATEIPEESPLGKPGLIVATHADKVSSEDLATLAELLGSPLKICGVDCLGKAGFDALAENIWRLLHVVRVYTKRPGQHPDLANPFTLPLGATVEDLAVAIHRDLAEKIKYARMWGPGRHDGQQVHRTEELHDKDIVELHE